MGMKLKSGADLCGFQLTNFCVQGEASAPSDAALGRKYFHTNATDDVATGISLLNRERIYLGEGAWRATAYLDDIANLQGKIDALDELLNGEDSQTYVDTWEEVKAFLEGVTENQDLMDLLNNKADKSQLADYLPLSGGTIAVSSYTGFSVRNTTDALSVIRYRGNVSGTNTVFGYLGFNGIDTPIYMSTSGTSHTLIHSGNIGSYAIKVNPVNINLETDTNVAGYGQTTEGWPIAGPALLLGNSVGNFAMMLSGRNGVLRFNTRENGALTGWKTIAFTDSNVASATKLQTARTIWGQSFDGTGDVSGDIYLGTGNIRSNSGHSVFIANTYTHIGYGSSTNGYDTYIDGNNIYLRYGTSHANGLFLNSSGNVLIGTTTDSGEKLQVDGKASLTDRLYAPYIFMGKNEAGIYIHKTGISWHNAANAYVADLAYFASDSIEIRKPVTISGDLLVKGNIVSEKEVSAKGAGAEEGTSGSGSAEGVAYPFTPTSTSMAFDHNLGEDVIVQVYEKSGNVWNMVIVDTEITSATRVTLRFGKTETTQHKVVIMGV